MTSLQAGRTIELQVTTTFGPRDIALLTAAARGIKQEDQATLFDTSRPTIISAVGRLFAKLDAPNGVAAVRKADRAGILLDEDDSMSDDTLRALWSAGYNWSKVEDTPAKPSKAPAKAAKGASKAGTPKGRTAARKPRSGKVTTRTATAAERAKMSADAAKTKVENIKREGVPS